MKFWNFIIIIIISLFSNYCICENLIITKLEKFLIKTPSKFLPAKYKELLEIIKSNEPSCEPPQKLRFFVMPNREFYCKQTCVEKTKILTTNLNDLFTKILIKTNQLLNTGQPKNKIFVKLLPETKSQCVQNGKNKNTCRCSIRIKQLYGSISAKLIIDEVLKKITKKPHDVANVKNMSPQDLLTHPHNCSSTRDQSSGSLTINSPGLQRINSPRRPQRSRFALQRRGLDLSFFFSALSNFIIWLTVAMLIIVLFPATGILGLVLLVAMTLLLCDIKALNKNK